MATRKRLMHRFRYTGCWIAPAAFALDRITKLFARTLLRGGAPVHVIPGMLRLVYVENDGAAFGILSGHQLLLLLLTGGALLGLLAFLLLRGQKMTLSARASLWLLIGGAAGNFCDRLLFGHVVDFFEFTFFRFPVFNVADCFVVLSFVLLALLILFGKDETDA